jgi:hypothetical protein
MSKSRGGVGAALVLGVAGLAFGPGCGDSDEGPAAVLPPEAGTPSTNVDSGGVEPKASCSGGRTACGESCTDIGTDRENCGACGAACAPSEVCSQGACGLSCGGGTTKCGDRCVDLTTDEAHCGACEAACGAGQTCAAMSGGGGACVCAAGLTLCGGACVDTQNDDAHCGSCGSPCTGADKECVLGVCRSGPISEWRFDDDLTDAKAKNDGVADGTLTFSDLSWSQARGKAAVFDNTNSVVVAVPVDLPLGTQPRTIEAWVRQTGSSDANYNGILSYGPRAGNNNGQLLSLRNNGFVSSANWGNDLLQTAGPLTVQTFSHVAFTWDGSQRRLFIDGHEVAIDTPSPFSTETGELRIGSTDAPGRRFIGLVDDVRVFDYARPAARLRRTANMDVHYAFTAAADAEDSGMHRISAGTKSATGLSAAADRNGVAGGALAFDGEPDTFFQIHPVHSLGKDRPYTIMAWVRPTVAAGVLAHVSRDANGASGGWCLPMLGIDAEGKPVANSWRPGGRTATSDDPIAAGAWVHLATSWGPGALKLYVNGVLKKTVAQDVFSSSNVTKYVTLGSHLQGTSCSGGNLGSFNGAMDDFKIFDRELTAAEIAAQAN